jgi:hypothetical protein
VIDEPCEVVVLDKVPKEDPEGVRGGEDEQGVALLGLVFWLVGHVLRLTELGELGLLLLVHFFLFLALLTLLFGFRVEGD